MASGLKCKPWARLRLVLPINGTASNDDVVFLHGVPSSARLGTLVTLTPFLRLNEMMYESM